MKNSDKKILRELVRAYLELAELPVQVERRERARAINDLSVERPVVWLNEIPWHEMDINGKLKLRCEDRFARQMEWYFRETLYRWEYIQADMVVAPYYPIMKAHTISGMGIEVAEDLIATDDRNHIVSHAYIDQLDSFEKVEALNEPVVTAMPEMDKKLTDIAEDVLDGMLPVRLVGHYHYHAPWDNIPRYRGVTNMLMDLFDRPELMHRTMEKFTAYGLSVMEQMESLGLLEDDVLDLHCTPGYVSGLAPAEGEPVKLKNIWFRAMAQIFTDVSPAMWEEFELQYAKTLAKKCGLTYYGCCEALDVKLELLKKHIPNLRKIGVPTRANAELNAEQIGKEYVYAYKPNPAFVSGSFDPKPVQQEINKVIKACQKHGCPYEFVLKDISTVGYKPNNLIEWTKIVVNEINKYYN